MAFAADPLKPDGPNNPNRFDEWLLCLDKMIYSFEWIAKYKNWDGPEVKNYDKEHAKILKPYRSKLKKLAQQDKERFKKIEPNAALNSLEWDRNSKIVQPLLKKYLPKFEEHRTKIQEGINLFAKHFGCLWV